MNEIKKIHSPVETPTTSQLMARNSAMRSENAMISVGQTNVLKNYVKGN